MRDPKKNPEQFKNCPIGRVPIEWDCPTLGALAIHVGSGITPRGGSEVYQSEGVLFIRSQNVHSDGLRLEDVVYISRRMHEAMKRSAVLPYDVLLNITGASIGRVCFFPKAIGLANVNQHVCVIRLRQPDEIDSRLLTAMLVSSIGQLQIRRLNAGGNRPGLNYEQLRAFAVPWPHKDERQFTVRVLSESENRLAQERAILAKLKCLKQGFMDDLLTGRVRCQTPMEVRG